jgi:hypothetical protein
VPFRLGVLAMGDPRRRLRGSQLYRKG